MPQIRPEEIRFFEALREAGVLEDINGNRLDSSKGVILITCADGDQMSNVFKHAELLSSRIHTLALNGGGLLLPSASPANVPLMRGFDLQLHGVPLNQILNAQDFAKVDSFLLQNSPRLGDMFMEQIMDARELKSIDLFLLHVHFPCGIARKFNIDPHQLMDLLVSAKDMLKTRMPDAKVCADIHIAWPDDRKRTYFVSRDKWRQYAIAHPDRLQNIT